MRSVSSIVAALVLGGLMASPASAEPPRLEVGQPFPDIAFPSAEDGTPMSIADFRGQKVVLHVFASW